MVEWLKRLDYSTESRRKVVSSKLGFAMRRLENSVNLAVNEYLFRIREGSGSERRGMGSTFHQLCPRYSGALTPTAPTVIRLWETFTFLILAIHFDKKNIEPTTLPRLDV